MTNKLTPKQEAFIHEYVKDKNGTQAAIRAGYSPNGAEVTASKLLINTKVKARVEELLSEVAEKALCDAQWVVERLMEEAQGLAEDSTQAGRVGALKVLSEYTGGFDANKRKVEHSGEGISFNMNFGTDED